MPTARRRQSVRARPVGRRRAGAMLVLAVVAALAGCSATGRDGVLVEPQTPAASPDNGAYPVTIEHALGTTVIPAEPERVVTLGWSSQDTVLALGVMPVGVPFDSWAGDPETGLLPWTAEAIAEMEDEEPPTTIVDLPEVDVEEVAALQPDLILATHSGISAEVYQQLSALAPTVAYPGQPWLTSWQEQTLINGRALGREADAEQLVAGMEQRIADVAEVNPVLTGTTFAFVYASPEGTLSAYVEGDPRVDLLTALGMELTPGIAALDAPDGTFFVDLGSEGTDLLEDADVVLTWFDDPAQQAAVEALGTFSSIPAVQRGTYLPLLDRELSMALSTTTALSLPWALDTFVAQLVAAVQGPDTE